MPTNWGARSFNGTSDTITGSVVINPPAVTLSVWLNSNSFANTYSMPIGVANSTTTHFQILTKSTGKAAYYIGATATVSVDPGTTTMSTGKWYHLALTYDSSTGLKTYLNGISDGTAAANGAILTTGSILLQFGNQVGLTRFVNGSIADGAVWNVVLSAAEITALSQGQRPGNIRPASLISWLPLDGLQSPEVDLSGTKNNGTLTGTTPAFGPPYAPLTPRWPLYAPIINPQPPVWGSRSFNGNGDNITATTISLVRPLTMVAWVYPARAATNATQLILANGNTGSNGSQIAQGNTAVFANGHWYYAASGINFADGRSTLALNTWSHIAATHAANGTITPYTNGVAGATTSLAYNSPSGANLVIGGINGFQNSILGRLADCALWNVALTAGEISALANGARPNMIRPTSLVGWWPADGLQSPEPDLSGNKNNGTVAGAIPAFGPPYAQLTPRWPMNAPFNNSPAAVSAFLAARAMRANQLYTGYPTM